MLNRKKSVECTDYALPENCKFSRYDLGWLLSWINPIDRILVVRKDISDDDLNNSFSLLCRWIFENTKSSLYLESKYYDKLTTKINGLSKECTKVVNRIHSYSANNFIPIDLIITIGGDGTLMKASAYFRGICPPILAYNMGTLGFLAPFNFQHFTTSLPSVLTGKVPCILRNRITFCVNKNRQSIVAARGDVSHTECEEEEDDDLNEYLALNEVVIDRGSSNHMLSLLVEVNGNLITNIKGDGLIVSTPTGSTAYSMSTGASIVHPTVRGMLLAPINPFSLSMRPIFLPVGVEITVTLDPAGRSSTANVSFDGNPQHWELGKPDVPGNSPMFSSVTLTVSRFPVISICQADHISDWFQGLSSGLNWNKHNTTRIDSSSSK